MLRQSDNDSETEILLGNKQLLGIFLVVALLLGVSFTGGFLIGRGGLGKKPNTATAGTADSGTTQTATGGQTHTLEGDTTLPAAASGGADTEAAGPASRLQTGNAVEPPRTTEPIVGSHRRATASTPAAKPAASTELKVNEPQSSGYEPRAGAEYLQVAAVGRDEAEAVADVLHKKGFRAHAVPKPGSTKLFRVIIGPVKDAGELSSTRDALRKTGFREVIVQRY